jgi:putative component of membrane protein insertase Oxa1/YidC/SpoIIIJ protein YidD
MMRKSLNNTLLIFCIFSVSFSCFAQKSFFRSDIEQINIRLLQQEHDHDHLRRSYIYKDEHSIIKKFNPVGLMLGGTLYVYQNVISKHISADCLFTPSCSDFCKQAIKEAGLLKGALLSIDRVNRCNRIAAQDLKRYNIDSKTGRYPDPVSRHRKASNHNEE